MQEKAQNIRIDNNVNRVRKKVITKSSRKKVKLYNGQSLKRENEIHQSKQREEVRKKI